jgi:hypothetical protein
MTRALDLTPHMPDDPLMVPAWTACLLWAVQHPEMLQEFRVATGMQWQPGRTGLERAIDEATGADDAFVEAFVRWFNANVWGEFGDDHE